MFINGNDYSNEKQDFYAMHQKGSANFSLHFYKGYCTSLEGVLLVFSVVFVVSVVSVV
jgi:hypothetical protein